MLFQRREVLGSSIAFMLRKTVDRVKRVSLDHHAIARDLCDHTRCRDAVAEPISTDERGLFDGEWFHGQAIDQHVLHENS